MEPLYLLTAVMLAQTSFLTYKATAPAKQKLKQSIVCDTSVLIDGRIVSIARAGFVNTNFIVPSSVLRELQYMADKADHDKRERARFGLDNVSVLQSIDQISVTIYDDGPLSDGGVDERLLTLAKKFSARLCTTDYNLNKVARAESIFVININELAHALRPQHLPGERTTLEIVQPGQGRDQGIGYLDDGTMVVIDNAKKRIGERVEVEAIRLLQTEAGRMMFAKLTTEPVSDTLAPQPLKNKRQESKNKPSRTPRQKRTAEDSLIELANK